MNIDSKCQSSRKSQMSRKVTLSLTSCNRANYQQDERSDNGEDNVATLFNWNF